MLAASARNRTNIFKDIIASFCAVLFALEGDDELFEGESASHLFKAATILMRPMPQRKNGGNLLGLALFDKF